ncbi:beta-carboxysome assembly chaperone CcmS [Crocosphaera sp. Alani8]|uniref:beta-carboxysome assembly chaperone CcmS n=1 Tax=Crocosphaera sp. Alani8 TaxID=3038952 RepID=UPI00313E6AEB
MQFGESVPDNLENQWRHQLDRFVRENRQELAALAWGLKKEWENEQDVLGIDLEPEPHFIRCTRQSLEELNHNVEGKIQEVLGICDNYNYNEEVAMIAINQGQIKLIYYQCDPFPPVCFEEAQLGLDSLIEQLETTMKSITWKG